MLEVPIITAIVSNGVLHIFINVLLIYLQIIIQFGWPVFKRNNVNWQEDYWSLHGRNIRQNKTTEKVEKPQETLPRQIS